MRLNSFPWENLKHIIWSAQVWIKWLVFDTLILFHVWTTESTDQSSWNGEQRLILRDSPLSGIAAVIRSVSSGISGEFAGTKWTCSPRPARCKSRTTWPCNCNVRSISYRLVPRFPYRAYSDMPRLQGACIIICGVLRAPHCQGF